LNVEVFNFQTIDIQYFLALTFFPCEDDIGDLDRVKKANLNFVTNIIKVLRTDHEYLCKINFTERLKNIIGIFNDLK